MRFLLSISCLVLLGGCTPLYKSLQPASAGVEDLLKFRPVFPGTLYRATVDVAGNHLSGLLLVKKMPDSSTRWVFSNEAGLSFFDFAFYDGGGFRVFSIIKKMNKKPVIKTLRKDFALLQMNGLDTSRMMVRKGETGLYFTFPQGSGFDHYVVAKNGSELVRMERSSKRSVVMAAIMKNYSAAGTPDTIGISHTNFTFNVGLKRIDR